jgi:glutaredoxin
MLTLRERLVGRLLSVSENIAARQVVVRDPREQAKIDAMTSRYVLYQYESCPYCVKVRKIMKKRALNIELRDVLRVERYRNELISHGGEFKVPCLKYIDDSGQIQWLYESSKIIDFLAEKFTLQSDPF